MKAHNVFEYPEDFAIVMPYCSQGSLAGLMLDPVELKDAVRQILKALQHLHDLGYIHRDIKPANILVSNLEGEALHVIVADYGLLTSDNPVTNMGTPGYMASEITINEKYFNRLKQYDNKVDIYALGILILRMLGLETPSHRIETQKEFTKRIKSLIAEESDRCGRDDFDRFDVLTVADRMLQYAPIIRPSAHECLQLPCLDLATAPPAAMHWRSPTASASTTKSGASVPAKPPAKDYWEATWSRDRNKHKRVPKQYSPAGPVHYYRAQQGKYHLPTPKTTPQKANKGLKIEEEEEPEEPGMADDSPSPVSNWDEMPLSE